jgi:hypothetical protein
MKIFQGKHVSEEGQTEFAEILFSLLISKTEFQQMESLVDFIE